jgi:hypothetical protein
LLVDEPYTDDELDRGMPLWREDFKRLGYPIDIRHIPSLYATVERLMAERDKAIDDAAFLSGCAAQLLHGGDALIEEVAENAYDDLQRQLRRMFDPLRLSDVMSRYVDTEPEASAEVAGG